MTFQTKLNRKQGFRKGIQKLAKLTIVIAASLMIFAMGTTKATSPVNSTAKVVALQMSGTTQGSFSLSEEASGPSLSIAMNATFVANYPTATMVANVEPDNQTIAITIFNAPESGAQEVGAITVTDDSGVEIAVASVSLKDGILETSVSEF